MSLSVDHSESNMVFIHSALDDAGLSMAAFRLFCHLSRRAGKAGVYPAAESMAEVCRMNRDTVWRGLAELEERGMLVRIPRPGRSTEVTLEPPSRWRNIGGSGKEGAPPEFRYQVAEKRGHQVAEKEGHEGNPTKDIQEGNPVLIDVPPAAPDPKPRNVPRQIKMERPSMETVVAFVKSLGLPASDGENCYYKWESNEWTNNNKPIRNWEATIRSWKAGGFLPSQRASSSPRTFGTLPQNPQKKEKREPDQLAALLATVRLLYPNACPVPWAELPLNIRREAEAALASTLVLS